MADDVWYRMLAGHSSCCGIQVLSAVRNPRESLEHYGALNFYGSGFPGMPDNSGWRQSEFDPFKWDEAVDAVPNLTENAAWKYRFKTNKPKSGMQILRFVELGAEVPEGFTVLAKNSQGQLIGQVHV
jgi:hypothetical protein